MEEQPHRELCDVLMALSQPMFPDCIFDIQTQWVLDTMQNAEELMTMALIMLPRGSFKSTVASNGFPIWIAWHDINLRIMIDSETLANAKYYLAGIKDMIVGNDLLKVIAVDTNGDYILEPNLSIPGGFCEDSIIFAKRAIRGLKEPSMFCSGVDNARTGLHMEVIIMDDLVSERNVKTPEQIEKTKEHYKFSLSLLEPTGRAIVIGTRYHLNDLYSELLKDDTYMHLVRPAVLDDGSLYFPTRLTQKFLDAQRKKQGSRIYASQYMLSPIADDTIMFKDYDIMIYTKAPAFNRKFITVDLAISEKQTSDERVVLAVGATSMQDIYCLDCVHGIFSPFIHIDHIFTMAAKHDIRDVGIEVVAYQKAFVYMLQTEMKRRGIMLRITELKARGSKVERANALVPYVEQHKFYTLPNMQDLRTQLTTFPFAAHDDMVDACAYCVPMLHPYSIGKSISNQRRTPTYSSTGY